MTTLANDAITLFERGGPVMWPLLGMSLMSGTLILERLWFWFRVHKPGTQAVLQLAISGLRIGTEPQCTLPFYREIIEYSKAMPSDDVLAIELVEAFRGRLEQFTTVLTVIASTAPLVGILGTVLGIIGAFDLLGDGVESQDISSIASSIAEALISTGVGLVVALMTLIPAALFRSQANRSIGFIERIAAARYSAASQKEA